MTSALKRLVNKGLATPPDWLLTNMHLEVVHGSRAYNLHTEESDYDIYGVVIPPKRYLFPHLESYIVGWDRNIPKFDQYEQKSIVEPDSKKEFSFNIYNIVKFFRLAADNNPNILQTLFVNSTCIKHCTVVGHNILEHRKDFLSKKAWEKFRGYASTQVHKCTHEEPTGKRKALCQKYGFDIKFASMALKLLSDCEYLFKYNDLDLMYNSDEGRAIRRGEWTLDRFLKEFEQRKLATEYLYAKSDLPNEPDEEKIKDLLIKSIDSHYKILGTDALVRAKAETIALREIDAALNKVRNLL